jgi:hypothetical protein
MNFGQKYVKIAIIVIWKIGNSAKKTERKKKMLAQLPKFYYDPPKA